MQETPQVNLIFVNGKIGSGKGTMVPRLLRTLPDSTLISTGDIYRSARDRVGEYAQFHNDISRFVDLVENQGGLIRDEVMVPIVGKVLARKVNEGFKNFVFDGFPRTDPQLTEADEMIKNLRYRFGERNLIARFVCLATTDSISLRRVERRRQNDIRQGKAPRPEDEPKAAKKRLVVYNESGKTNDMLHRLAREKRLMVIKGNGGRTDEWRRLERELEYGRATERELPRVPHGKET